LTCENEVSKMVIQEVVHQKVLPMTAHLDEPEIFKT
jgi:hypothetical protein